MKTITINGSDGSTWVNVDTSSLSLSWNRGKECRMGLDGYPMFFPDNYNIIIYVEFKLAGEKVINKEYISEAEHLRLIKIIENYKKEKEMNENKTIRDGWYKIKNQKDIDKGHELIRELENDLPKHHIIKIVGGRWHGWLVKPEAILHVWFEYGECVYVRDLDSQEWKKAKYHSYSNDHSSQLAVVSDCINWNYCISEKEWKEKYEEKPMEIHVIGDCNAVVSITIHNNEEVTIARCGDNITYETEKINN